MSVAGLQLPNLFWELKDADEAIAEPLSANVVRLDAVHVDGRRTFECNKEFVIETGQFDSEETCRLAFDKWRQTHDFKAVKLASELPCWVWKQSY